MNTPDLDDLTRADAADGIDQHVVGALIDHGGTLLLLKRPADDFRGGTWELPSGKVEPTDTDLYAALHREVTEETGLTISTITGYLGAFDYTSSSGKHTRQHTWTVTVANPAEVHLSEHDESAWVATTEQHPVSAEVQRLIDAHLASPAHRLHTLNNPASTYN
ncbi:NUDIX domain-containing protein [Actinopolyspora erythraea]|uniref:8-oxo-dGTP diphosphatase n=1 Tax=Actinopolyspora erythraea TaxID=414996 RepID=A0A223RSU7_9ACTN|nr:NUDIX domain-containing protein [Actinopolyspora erythraea]ASU78942.1 NUDIX domain-containing protein [Actinopolyspora erythraea]